MFFLLPFGAFFVFLMIFGTMMSICSFHWLFIWAGFEVNLMGFIPLLMYSGLSSRAECAVKYFLVQALGSVMFISGGVFFFGNEISWDLSSVMGGLNMMSFLEFFGVYLFCISLLLKLGCFPFYFWVPSVVMSGSWFTCFLLLTWQKISPFFIFIMFGGLFFSGVFWLVLVSAVGSAFFGGVGGIGESYTRSLMAYSSISHSGWMLFSCVHGFGVLISYFLIYFFISCCLFVLLSLIDSKYINSFSNSGSDSSLVEWGMISVLLSLGGVPPFLGFLGKWVVVSIGVNSLMIFSVFLLILGSLLSMYYYFLLFFGFFFSKSSLLISSNGLMVSNLSMNYLLYHVLVICLTINFLGSMFCLFV